MGRSVSILLLVLAGAPVSASAQARTGTVTGIVRDWNGIPLGGAEVQLLGTGLRDSADVHGRYRFTAVPPAIVQVRATFVGYLPVRTDSIALHAGEELQIDLSLPRHPVWNPGNQIIEAAPERPR